ncbi:MAG: GNAT family N-acetyltransferase [Gammaproteobacteria bacterium]|nr:GNAT family N-acetyltransferase [Gammaproteobacteria bacterium]
MRIETLHTTAAFDTLRDHWLALETGSTDASVFATWDWQRIWWTHYGGGRQLRLLVARQNRDVLGILPLYLERSRMGKVWPTTVLRQVGIGGDTAPDDLDPPIAPGYEREVAAAFADAIVGMSDWRRLHLIDLRPDGALLRALVVRAAAARLDTFHDLPVQITYTDLPSTWDAFLAGMSSHGRAAVRRNRRIFLKEPESRFVRIDGATEIDRAFADLARLHRMRWAGRTDQASFSSAAYLGFHREVMRALFQRGRLRLFALQRDGEPIAMFYGMRMRNTSFYFQSGFDPAWSGLRLGSVMVAYVIEDAIAEGCTRFDMLRGDYEHKKRFGRSVRTTTGVRLFRSGLAARIYRILKMRQQDSQARDATPASPPAGVDGTAPEA